MVTIHILLVYYKLNLRSGKMQDYQQLYKRVPKKTVVEKLEKIRRLVRQGLPPTIAIALIIIITRR